MDQVRRFAALALTSLMLTFVPGAIPALQHSPTSSDPAMRSDDSTRTMLMDLIGSSGKLRAVIGTVATLSRHATLRPLLAPALFDAPGVHPLALVAPDGDSLVVVTMQSFEDAKRGSVGGYSVGHWPTRGPAARDPRYAPPPAYISVSPENAFTPVSKRFLLRDFLTHDQQAEWPKVLVLGVSLLDKLEHIGDELERRGHSGILHVMSGFRTPQYNAQGVGPLGGRAGDSRHMYGDAADVFVDGDGDGRMDDLDGDGRVTIRDAQVLLAVAEAIEARHPELAGGLSAYPAGTAHGPFVHVDTRGERARW